MCSPARDRGHDARAAAAVVVAAGAGARLGGSRPKLFAELSGRPLVSYSLSILEECSGIGRVVLVVPAGLEEEVRERVVGRFCFGKIERIVAGGDARGESVFAGLLELNAQTRTVLIHDGARPLVTRDLVERVLEAAEQFGAAVPGIPSSDTLKRVEDETAVATLDRTRIQRIQTPQGFHYPVIVEAHERAREQGETASDDATLVERMGTRVHVVPGSPSNIKITTPEDLKIAEALLAARSEN